MWLSEEDTTERVKSVFSQKWMRLCTEVDAIGFGIYKDLRPVLNGETDEIVCRLTGTAPYENELRTLSAFAS
jgi:hypothetical protein